MTPIRLALLDAPPQARDEYAAAVSRLRGVQLVRSAADDHDAVVIFGRASAAAVAGKHLFVESLTDWTIDSVDALATACRTSNVRLMFGQRLRFDPAIAAVKSALDKGQLGAPALVRTHAWGTDGDDPADPIDRLLLEQLDAACWIFGAPPSDVFALGQGERGNAGWPAFVQVHLGFPGGGMALLTATTMLPAGDDYRTLSVIGTTGAAYADDHHQMQLTFRGGGARAIATQAGVAAVTAQLREFIDAITAGRSPSMSGADVSRAHAIAAAAKQALAAGEAVCFSGGAHAG